MNNSKQKQLKELTRKYFWEQKRKEVGNFILIIYFILSFVLLIIQIGWVCKTTDGDMWGSSKDICIFPYEPTIPYWILITGLINTVIWILIGLIKAIHYWIKSNLEEADRRARTELKIPLKEKENKWNDI